MAEMAEEETQPKQEIKSGTPEQSQRAKVAIAEIQSDLGDAKSQGDTLARRDELTKKPNPDESEKRELKELNEELKEQFGPGTQEVISEWEKAKGVRAAAGELEK